MRLDHLLSTEFFLRTPAWRPSCGPCVGNGSRSCVGVLVWKRSLASRVPFGGLREWYGYAFGFPDRHPRLGRARFSGCPRRDAVGLWAVGRFRSGAWWFENWIVDASNAGLLSCLLYRDFARLFFLESGFEIDRFVIIVYSVMICRLA